MGDTAPSNIVNAQTVARLTLMGRKGFNTDADTSSLVSKMNIDRWRTIRRFFRAKLEQ